METKFNNLMVNALHSIKDKCTEDQWECLRKWYTSYKTSENRHDWLVNYVASMKPFEHAILTKDNSIFALDDPVYKSMKIEFLGPHTRDLFEDFVNIKSQNLLWEITQMLYVFALQVVGDSKDVIESIMYTIQCQQESKDNSSELVSSFGSFKSMQVLSEIYNVFKVKIQDTINLDCQDYTSLINEVLSNESRIGSCILIFLNTCVGIIDKHIDDPVFIKNITDDLFTISDTLLSKVDEIKSMIPEMLWKPMLASLKQSEMWKQIPKNIRNASLDELVDTIKTKTDEFKTYDNTSELFTEYYTMFRDYIEDANNNPDLIENYTSNLINTISALCKKNGIDIRDPKSIEMISKNPEAFVMNLISNIQGLKLN